MKKKTKKVYNIHHGNAPKNAVNIMRPNRWGNLYRIGIDGDRGTCLTKFRELISENPGLKKMIREELRGRDLVCCCKPKDCHGDILLEIANAYNFISFRYKVTFGSLKVNKYLLYASIISIIAT